MISANNKKKIQEKMKGVVVVKTNKKEAPTSSSKKVRSAASADSLKKKYTKESENDNTDKLVQKFLGNTKSSAKSGSKIKGADSFDKTSKSDAPIVEDEQVEVGRIKGKNKESDEEVNPERTIIISKKGNILGAQG